MKLYIDNLDLAGPRSYGEYLGGDRGPLVRRKLNQPDECEFTLVGEGGLVKFPVEGARVELVREDGTKVFTGFVSVAASAKCIGEGERGAWESRTFRAEGEEYLLDRRPLTNRPDYINELVGPLLRELIEELCPGTFDTSAVEEGEKVYRLSCGSTRRWSQVAQELAASTRCSYRVHDGAVRLSRIGDITHELREGDPSLDLRELRISRGGRVVNDATVLGGKEPAAYVRDEFAGDGFELRFPLSNYPFLRVPYTVAEEEFIEELSPRLWQTSGIAAIGGKLEAAGAPGSVALRQSLELGGAWLFQHGELTVESGNGWIGGLFNGEIETSRCVAAFRASDSNGQRTIRAFVNGLGFGDPVVVRPNCRYALNTRIYADELFRFRPTFRSSRTTAGGGDVPSGIRVVLECREIDPANAGSLVAPAQVLFDDLLTESPASCRYVPLASENLRASTNFVRIRRMPDVVVRSGAPGQPFRTRLVGALSEGAECTISNGAIYFYTANPPEPNESIAVSYRTGSRPAGRARDEASIADLARLTDDGLRAAVSSLAWPTATSSEDCVLAAIAWLEDSAHAGFYGEYSCWREALPGGDIFPGDQAHIDSRSAEANFLAIVREVEIEAVDMATEHERLKIRFADEACEPLAMLLEGEQSGMEWPRVIVDANGPAALASLPSARVTALTSTTATIDTDVVPSAGGGFEVRRSDGGWGADIDRNLIGRFSTKAFTLPRLARNQQYCIRQYDNATPPRYSRHTTILYVDRPL